ncbi:MAG TPA: peptidylprolyl isomerase [Longimicrobiales bacterium]|nr:peptidylprolyl isomerase [Longimicrobiales bacterium]
MKNCRMLSVLAGLALLAACGGEQPTEGVVARAGKQDLTVDQTVQLLVDQENLPNQVEVVRALADLWVDYTLLASAVAADSTLGSLSLEPMVRQQLEQEMIFQLMDSVIQVDTVITDEDLRVAYEQEAPDAVIGARHILLSYPQQATQAQRDSVRATLDGIRRRVVAGERFDALARQYSEDPGSAAMGGDLGTFGRGEMVKPFEDAAFALQPGEISDIVETPYGLHLIKVESKEAPGFDQVKEQFRSRAQNQRVLQAESTYVAGIEAASSPEVTEGAMGVVKEIAKDPSTRLTARAADRALVSFQGGAFTVGEYQNLVQGQPPQFRESVQGATEEQIHNFLMGAAQRKLLVAEAAKAGMEPTQARVDSLVTEARRQILEVADQIGLRSLDRAPGEAVAPAVSRAVDQSLQDVLTGAADVVPLGQLSFQLRQRTQVQIFDAALGQVVLEVGRIRATRSPAPAEAGPPSADTVGN